MVRKISSRSKVFTLKDLRSKYQLHRERYADSALFYTYCIVGLWDCDV